MKKWLTICCISAVLGLLPGTQANAFFDFDFEENPYLYRGHNPGHHLGNAIRYAYWGSEYPEVRRPVQPPVASRSPVPVGQPVWQGRYNRSQP